VIAGYIVAGFFAYSLINYTLQRVFEGRKAWVEKSPYMSGLEKEFWNIAGGFLGEFAGEFISARLALITGATPFVGKYIRRVADKIGSCSSLSLQAKPEPNEVSSVFIDKFSKMMMKQEQLPDLSLQGLRDFLSESAKNTLRALPSCNLTKDKLRKASIQKDALQKSMKFNFYINYLARRSL